MPDRLMISVWETEKESPRGVRSRISRSWEYVMLHGKGLSITAADRYEKPEKAKTWKPLEPSPEPPKRAQLF